jgi:hypothetical protein
MNNLLRWRNTRRGAKHVHSLFGIPTQQIISIQEHSRKNLVNDLSPKRITRARQNAMPHRVAPTEAASRGHDNSRECVKCYLSHLFAAISRKGGSREKKEYELQASHLTFRWPPGFRKDVREREASGARRWCCSEREELGEL